MNAPENLMVSTTPEWAGGTIVPERVVIETIYGCNARCSMCPIEMPSSRPKGIMPMDDFKRIVDALTPYREKVRMFDLFGLGEPLLDPLIFERIDYVRGAGFRNLAFSTNAHLLDAGKQKRLLDTGIETVIFSIDGVKKETHEAIRARTDFDRVMKNALDTVRRRDEGGYKTRFVVRFIRMDMNRDEWEPFREIWGRATSADKNDIVSCYDVHNWSGVVADKDSVVSRRDPELEATPCHHIFEKLVILANGAVALCFEDVLEGQFRFGNAAEEDPIAIFNSERFNRIRRLHMSGKRTNLKICGECSVLDNERTRQ